MQSPFTLKIQVVLLFWAAHGTQPEPQLQVVPGAFLAPGRKLGVCGACPAPRGALLGAGTVLGSEMGRWKAGAVGDGRAQLLLAGKASPVPPGRLCPHC